MLCLRLLIVIIFMPHVKEFFNPKLIGEPIAILSNNDGCVISRSNEAKALGIPMGAPAFKYDSVFKKYNVHVFSSNFPLYGDMSSRVMSILALIHRILRFTALMRLFWSLKDFDNYDLENYGKEIRKSIEMDWYSS